MHLEIPGGEHYGHWPDAPLYTRAPTYLVCVCVCVCVGEHGPDGRKHTRTPTYMFIEVEASLRACVCVCVFVCVCMYICTNIMYISIYLYMYTHTHTHTHKHIHTYIQDTFYVDTREADNRAFAEKELKGFAVQVTPLGHVPYAIKSMEKTRLGHLEVRI
jgi:hypothetical protein